MSKQFEGFKPPNTTPVPDIVFDELLSELTGNELKVLLYIIRRTYGFGKNADAISLSQFREGITTKDDKVLDKGCGLKHNRTILVALASLEKKGYVISKKRQNNAGDSDTTIYKLRFKMASEAIASDRVVTSGNHVVTSSNDGSYPTSPRWLPQVTTVVTSGNQQETVIQETVIQETVIQEGDTEFATSDEDRTAPIYLEVEREKRETNPRMLALTVSSHSQRLSETNSEEDVSLAETQQRIPIVKPSQHSPGAGTRSLAATPPGDGQDDSTSGQASLTLALTPARRSGIPPGNSPASPDAAQGGNSPPMAMTARDIKKQNEKRAKELWVIIEDELHTTFTENQRKAHKDGIASLIADDLSDEAIRTGLQALNTFERRTFTVSKFYGWLPNLNAKAPTPITKGKPAESNGVDHERNKQHLEELTRRFNEEGPKLEGLKLRHA